MMIPGAGPSANYWVEEFIVWGATIFTAGRDEQLITLPHRKTTSRPQFVSLILTMFTVRSLSFLVPIPSSRCVGFRNPPFECRPILMRGWSWQFCGNEAPWHQIGQNITIQCTMLPLSTKSCLKSSKLRLISNGQFCHAISKNICLNVLGSKQPREILFFLWFPNSNFAILSKICSY